ncbi:hypothetical protein VPH35_116844 [Triticum aestivum]
MFLSRATHLTNTRKRSPTHLLLRSRPLSFEQHDAATTASLPGSRRRRAPATNRTASLPRPSTAPPLRPPSRAATATTLPTSPPTGAPPHPRPQPETPPHLLPGFRGIVPHTLPLTTGATTGAGCSTTYWPSPLPSTSIGPTPAIERRRPPSPSTFLCA